MRLPLLLVTGTLAAGLVACSSGGGSQALPNGAAVAPMAHSGLHLASTGGQRDASCPSSDFACVTVNSSSGGAIGICVSSSGVCSGTLPGPFKWKSVITKNKTGKKFKTMKAKFSPNPGNPVTDTITEKKPVKSSKGNYLYTQTITACTLGSSPSCLSGTIGIATD